MSKELPLIDLRSTTYKQMPDQQKAAILFGGLYKIVNSSITEVKAENPREYERLRVIAKDVLGISLGPSVEQRAEERRQAAVMHPPEPPLSAEVLKAREIFDLKKCEEMFSTRGAELLAATDPASYRVLQTAARSFDVIGAGNSFRVTERASGHAAPPTPKPTCNPEDDPNTPDFYLARSPIGKELLARERAAKVEQK